MATLEFENEVLPFGKGTVNEMFGAARLLGGEQSDFLPPIGMDLIDRVREHVQPTGVSLKATIVWQGQKERFAHHEVVGEEWLFKYRSSLAFKDGGQWDSRTPILHPAVAAVDATQAGYDDAYLRAMQNVDIIVGVQRDESRVAIRRMVERYSKLTYSPFRVLLRGAVLWTVLAAKEMNKSGMTPYEATGVRPPARIGDAGGYASIAQAQMDTINDVLYIRCENAGELYMVEVLQAMCSAVFPVETEMSISGVWPPLASPYVVYTSTNMIRLGTGRVDAFQVQATLQRFADVFDCHDLLAEAMQAAQFFVCRPQGAGVLAGTTNLVWPLPRSDMRVGAIGPLLAGISAEGMRSVPFVFPQPAMFLYGAAARACFITAGYYESLLKYDDMHPVAQATSDRSYYAKYRLLSLASSSRHFITSTVVPRVASAGWDCYTRALTWIHPRESRGFVKHLCKATDVPWWTNILLHMRDMGKEFMDTWARPARIVGMPVPGRWYSYQMLRGVTAEQLGAAVRWVKAEVRYCVDDYSRKRRWLKVEPGTVNRFIPNLTPVVRVGRETLGVATVRFGTTVYTMMGFLESLSTSMVTVVKESRPSDNMAAIDMLELAMTAGPTNGDTAEEVDSDFEEESVASDAEAADGHDDEEPLEPVVVQPHEDDVDWTGIAKALTQGGLQGVSGAVLVSALNAPVVEGSDESRAAARLAALPVTSVLLRVPAANRRTFLRAVILASGRLAVHAATPALNESLAYRQADAVSALNALADRQRPVANWSSADGTEAAATEVLTAGVGEEAKEVPVARDDPAGPSMSVADFGDGTSGPVSQLEREMAAVAGVPVRSHPAAIGFEPPPVLET